MNDTCQVHADLLAQTHPAPKKKAKFAASCLPAFATVASKGANSALLLTPARYRSGKIHSAQQARLS